MIDHFTVTVADLRVSREFYGKVLAQLGYRELMEYQEFVGFGDHKPYLWLKGASPPTTPQHIAFRAPSREAVDAFYRAALEAGGKDNGAPGLRDHYHEHYYGAFVLDPHNGHPLEAVCHAPPVRPKKKKASRRKGRATRSPHRDRRVR